MAEKTRLGLVFYKANDIAKIMPCKTRRSVAKTVGVHCFYFAPFKSRLKNLYNQKRPKATKVTLGLLWRRRRDLNSCYAINVLTP